MKRIMFVVLVGVLIGMVPQAYTVEAQVEQTATAGTICRNYDLSSSYRHRFSLGFLGQVSLPVSDEIRVLYRACWNDHMIWQGVPGIAIGRAAGSTYFQPSTQTVGAHFGNGSDFINLYSGVTHLFQPRVNASYKGVGLSGSVTVTIEVHVLKGGCATLYLNDWPVDRQGRCF